MIKITVFIIQSIPNLKNLSISIISSTIYFVILKPFLVA